MTDSYQMAQLKENGTETAQKVAPLKETFKAPNGALTREAVAMNLEMDSIEWQKLLEEALFKPLQETKKETPADLAFDAFWVGVLGIPKMLDLFLAEQRRLSKENQKKIDAAVKSAIDDSLKAKGLTRNSVMTQLALRGQDFLFSTDFVSFDEKGNVRKHGLNRIQKAHTQKYLFARKLPQNTDGTLAFHHFSSSQAKRFSHYMHIYATYNQAFKAYIQETMESVLSRRDLEKLSRFAVEMTLSGQAPKRRITSARMGIGVQGHAREMAA